MKKFELVKENLTKGQKITMVTCSEFGGMNAIQTVYSHCEIAPHYVNAPIEQDGVHIFHKPIDKRCMYSNTISFVTPLVIYDGYVDIDVESILFDFEETPIMQIRNSKYTMHDTQMWRDLEEKYPDYIFADYEKPQD